MSRGSSGGALCMDRRWRVWIQHGPWWPVTGRLWCYMDFLFLKRKLSPQETPASLPHLLLHQCCSFVCSDALSFLSLAGIRCEECYSVFETLPWETVWPDTPRLLLPLAWTLLVSGQASRQIPCTFLPSKVDGQGGEVWFLLLSSHPDPERMLTDYITPFPLG